MVSVMYANHYGFTHLSSGPDEEILQAALTYRIIRPLHILHITLELVHCSCSFHYTRNAATAILISEVVLLFPPASIAARRRRLLRLDNLTGGGSALVNAASGEVAK